MNFFVKQQKLCRIFTCKQAVSLMGPHFLALRTLKEICSGVTGSFFPKGREGGGRRT